MEKTLFKNIVTIQPKNGKKTQGNIIDLIHILGSILYSNYTETYGRIEPLTSPHAHYPNTLTTIPQVFFIIHSKELIYKFE